MPFTLDKTVKGRLALEQRAAKVPKVADLLSAASVGASHEGAKGLAPPPDIVAKVGCSSPVFAFDIETNTLVPGNTSCWVQGGFGFLARMAPSALQDMRTVQLGWASGPEVAGRIVKPEGFVITPDATEKHAITQDHAMQEGLPLKTVLTEFIEKALASVRQGGRLVAHHIEQRS